MGWFDELGITDYAPEGGTASGFAGPLDPGVVPIGPDGQPATTAPPAPAFNAAQQVGHNGVINGLNREQYRDAWQSSGAKSMADLQAFVAQHGGTINSANGTVTTPFGEQIDMGQNAMGSAAGKGQMTAAWGGVGGGGGGAQTGGVEPSLGAIGAGGGGGNYGGGGNFSSGGGGSYTGGDFTFAPMATPQAMAAPQNYTPEAVAGPAPLNLASISQPAAVQAGQVTPGAPISASQITAPEALTARNVNDPTGFKDLTAEQLQQDPSYQFRLSQGLGALENSAAAKGLLASPNLRKGLIDYAGQSASQEYQAANERGRQTYQQNLTNQASVTGQNNAAQAQAYGLTNQYGQQAQMANQAANLQSGQFNSQQQQQAQMANQSANLQAGQFNAGMNFNTQQQNVANQLGAYNAYQPLAQQNAQFNSGQQQQAAQQNFANQFAVGQFNTNTGLAANQQQFNQGLGAYQANVAAQLGQGNLNLGYQTAGQNYALGQGQLALGNLQANNSYNLGLGNLGVSQGQLGLAGQNQAFNQELQTFNTNYGVNQNNQNTAFNQGMQLANLGYGAASQYGNNAANLYTGQGNANAA